MIKKEKIAIVVGIGAVIGIGITFLAAVGLGKKKGAAYLKSALLRNKPSHNSVIGLFVSEKLYSLL